MVSRRADSPMSREPNLPGSAANTTPLESEFRRIFGLRFWDTDIERVARFLVDGAIAGERLGIYFVNAHCVNVAARDPAYATLLARAPFLFADGVGMAIAARLAGLRLQNNVNGTDLFPKVCAAAAAAGVPVAFLGARPGVASRCADAMRREFPRLSIVWVQHGYLAPEEERASLDELNASGAKLLFVAKGVPAQELWMARNADRIGPPVVLGVGALFDFYSGSIPRAPRVMRDLRIEWLYRLMLEPRRMFSRYLLGNPAFIARAVRWRAARQPLLDHGRDRS